MKQKKTKKTQELRLEQGQLQEYVRAAIDYKVGQAVAIYERRLEQWWGKEFLFKAPDSIIDAMADIFHKAELAKAKLIEMGVKFVPNPDWEKQFKSEKPKGKKK